MPHAPLPARHESILVRLGLPRQRRRRSHREEASVARDDARVPQGDTLIDVSDVSMRFGSLTVLDKVSFSVRCGEAVGVVGPNGSGKSTLLRCIVGAETLDSGEVLFEGTALDESRPEIRAAIACLLDDMDFFPDLSVVEHLRIYAWAHGADDPDELVDSVLQEVGLASAQDQLPTTLSSGQRHRLGLACLVRPRKALILDEPEQRLDTAGRTWLARRLTEEKELGRALIIASHDDDLLKTVADHVVEVGT